MPALTLHRDCKPGPIASASASIHATSAGCDVEFRLEGDLAAIALPQPQSSQRTAGLWQHTCFEFFWQPDGGAQYFEFNLAPSGQWAGYAFDAYREGMRDVPVGAIAITSAHSMANGRGGFELKASIAADLATPALVGLSAVIELTDGTLQYWALAHPAGKADFHAAECRAIRLER